MYTVHNMKQYSSTEARKHFFELLDSAVAGETVKIERKGVLITLTPKRIKKNKKKLNYNAHIHGNLNHADQWTWDWHPSKGLVSKRKK